MHKTTRQIWATSSPSSCLFCDLQLLFPRGTISRATPSTTIGGVRTQARGNSTLATRILPRTSSGRGQLSSRLGLFGPRARSILPTSTALTYPPRPQRHAVCTYTTKALARNEQSAHDTITTVTYRSITTKTISPCESNLFLHSHLLGSDQAGLILTGPRLLAGSRATLRARTRLLSTSTSPSVVSEIDSEGPLLTSAPTPSSPTAAVIQEATTSTLNEPATKSDFQSLFPEIPASFVDESSRDPFLSPVSDAPWRNGAMVEGSVLEESLRKSVYQRDPIGTWWPLYEEVAGQWRSPIRQEHALGRADFIRFIGALKISPQPLRDTSRLKKLEQVFDDFHRAITTPKSNAKVYGAFLGTLHFWKMDDVIPAWVARIKATIPTNTSTALSGSAHHVREYPQEQYHDLIRALADLGQADTVRQCVEELNHSRSDQLRPSVMAYDLLMESYMMRKDTAGAAKAFQEMQDQGLKPELTSFNTLLRGHLENKDARAAQRVLESLLLTDIRPDIYTFNLLMSGYLEMGEIDLVNGFYKGLGEYGLTPNSKTYRILMKSHLRRGKVDQVIELFSRLKESTQSDLHPRSEDYRVLLQALVSNGRMSDALRVLREMTETAKTPVTTPIYNVFVAQYARDGQIDKAWRILDKIIAAKLPLIDGSINPLLRAYLARRDFDKVSEITELMNRYGVTPSKTTFNIMIHSTKVSDNLDVAMQLYERMKVEGITPDVWTYNALLDLLVEKLRPVRESIRRKGDPNAVRKAQVEEYVPRIESLLQDMKSRGIRPDVVTYGKLIHQYVVLRDIEQAETLFHEMVKSGISPNAYAFNTLMNGFALIEDMDKAVELFRRMPKHGVQPDATTFTTLIKGYANLKQMTLAQDFANSLQQQSSKVQMDQHCLHMLMQLAQKSHQPGMALDFFEMMRGRGMEPDNVTFTILINSLSRQYAATSSKGRPGSRNRANRRSGGDQAAGVFEGMQSQSAAEAVESILGVLQQDGAPLHHSGITTVISAYFRLGRPLAAIGFFKNSFWKGHPKLSTTNCGALFHGLLAPELGRRYDGIVLNLYTRMLLGTKQAIRAEEAAKQSLENPLSADTPTYAEPTRKGPVSWDSSILPTASKSTKTTAASKDKVKFLPPHDLPILDLVTFNILFQSFSKKNNWSIVLQLWQDLESVGAEKLYPHEMPLEFLGWAAQAHHMIYERRSSHDGEPPRSSSFANASDDGEAPAETHAEKAEKLLKQLWNAHHKMGAEWSIRIYGYNMFKSLVPTPLTTAASANPVQSSSVASGNHHNNNNSSLLSSFLSGGVNQANYHDKSATSTHSSSFEEELKGTEQQSH
ncbi:hypothetical protein K457DRAFT_133492 [Linnemannia elongata AG-77]|uniref:Pentacotripeptide-repeat region of PRORP domain-containing protein n=1 Tax=Linnemannia elongata AG-77 TaxID=1314771 RepID=A0A197KAE2_9FUNG|nr:hypothetical protein K457DRAFT_133492 [Linnemannia elongata AG-77]